MHHTQYLQMAHSIATYVPMQGSYHVLEVGSRNKTSAQLTHRQLLAGRKVSYVGIDLLPGHNVDRVMKKPYSFPVPSRSVDVLIAGAVFEHIPFVWASMLEVGRVLRPGGYALVLAPSRGHEHNVYDCWRYYPDGYRALASWAALDLRDVFCDFPPTLPNKFHFDYAAIDQEKVILGGQCGGLPEAQSGLSGDSAGPSSSGGPSVGERQPRPRGCPAPAGRPCSATHSRGPVTEREQSRGGRG